MREALLNLGVLIGLVLFLVGLFMFSRPLATVVGGLILTVVCAALARAERE